MWRPTLPELTSRTKLLYWETGAPCSSILERGSCSWCLKEGQLLQVQGQPKEQYMISVTHSSNWSTYMIPSSRWKPRRTRQHQSANKWKDNIKIIILTLKSVVKTGFEKDKYWTLKHLSLIVAQCKSIWTCAYSLKHIVWCTVQYSASWAVILLCVIFGHKYTNFFAIAINVEKYKTHLNQLLKYVTI